MKYDENEFIKSNCTKNKTMYSTKQIQKYIAIFDIINTIFYYE